MIELHERLSEYSYGYGITREVDHLLESVGIRAAPFLPSLIQEAEVGFDVGFNKPGSVLMLQFKLGQSLRRFVRASPLKAVPQLERPFWRFKLNTAEHEGQFETLLNAELGGAEVYYVAPRFVDWPEYLELFEAERVLDNSLLIKPADIRNALLAAGEGDGWHKVAYDRQSAYVCSEPSFLRQIDIDTLVEETRRHTAPGANKLSQAVNTAFEGLETRRYVRRVPKLRQEGDSDGSPQHEAVLPTISPELASVARRSRLEKLRARAKSDDDAVAAALGIEVWSLGIQMVLVSAM